MHARVSTYEGPPERIDEAIAAFDADDRLLDLEGLEDAYLLVDRERGRMLTITLWERRDALDATAPSAGAIRTAAAGAGGPAVLAVESYEVALRARAAIEARRG
jgi:heme-degrading monooxygenase HmoA